MPVEDVHRSGGAFVNVFDVDVAAGAPAGPVAHVAVQNAEIFSVNVRADVHDTGKGSWCPCATHGLVRSHTSTASVSTR
jgi:hypothetical protein